MSSSRVTRSSNATRAHPPPKTRTGAVNFAIFTYLNTHRYLFPRTFPFIEETQLPKCFEPTMPIIGKPAEELEYATKRDFYFKIGVGILPHCLLLLLSEDAIHGKPAGYALDIRSAVQANAVLKRLAATVDPRIIKQISTGAAGGFLTFVGLLWTLRARNTESVARELQPFFLPLLEVAGDAWLSFENRNVVTSNSAASVHPEALRAADLRFIVNVQISQDTCPPVPRPLAEDSASSNSDSSDGSLCDSPSTHQPTIVPNSPAVNGSPLRNPYLLTFRSPSHAEVAVPNQPSFGLTDVASGSSWGLAPAFEFNAAQAHFKSPSRARTLSSSPVRLPLAPTNGKSPRASDKLGQAKITAGREVAVPKQPSFGLTDGAASSAGLAPAFEFNTAQAHFKSPSRARTLTSSPGRLPLTPANGRSPRTRCT
ncbi:hypothetical protein B0H16DRAFT_599829 [Mycena metata]|uniref:Uncharacterized protein n=1 Tax=Mycena metata TaxID=1033252 RepID=A0AAD7MD04_9AGAR|nr:hypothetical protein B0H16DRAFT_599829 [Mycena metata]